MVFELFRWWYGSGWAQAGRNISHMTAGVEQMFSINILLRTLFAPWRRIVSLPGRGLDSKIQAMFDNLVSRLVGFMVRFLVLIAASVTLAVVFLFGVVMVVIWPAIPLGIVYCIARSVIG